MLGEIGRVGRAGAIVCFRLEDTMELLWKSAMEFVPEVDWLVGALPNGGEVETWYKVEQIRAEFQYESGMAGGGEVPEIPWTADYASVGPCVIVSEVV